MLTALGPGIWVLRNRLVKLGADARRQLVVVRLTGGGLWVHSPPPVVTTELRSALRELGEVRHVVAPSRWHDEGLAGFQAAYPAAQFHATPGIENDCREVRFAHPLSDKAHDDWVTDLEQHLVRGMPRMNEVVFFHRASRSLILADLALNVGPPGTRWEQLLFTLTGAWGRFTPTRLGRLLMRDRAAVRASIDHVLTWDFDRIIVGHGTNIETAGRTALRAAFAFLR